MLIIYANLRAHIFYKIIVFFFFFSNHYKTISTSALLYTTHRTGFSFSINFVVNYTIIYYLSDITQCNVWGAIWC